MIKENKGQKINLEDFNILNKYKEISKECIENNWIIKELF